MRDFATRKPEKADTAPLSSGNKESSMRPNLSLEAFAGALAIIGTTALVGCGGDAKPADAPSNATTTAPSTNDTTSTTSAAGASTMGATPTTDMAPTTPSSPSMGGASTTTPSTMAPSTPSTPTPASTTSTTAPAKKPAAGSAKGGSNAQASCGAGTCSGKK